ncbi:MAG TPA: hypothetical protein VGV12_01525 [Gemmatimonadales bacterium]|nr:hypothetical protein [Gemmatimonadales bacterium]
MRRPIGATLFILGMVGAGCEQPQPTAPNLTRPLSAAATTTLVSASGTLTITDPGKQWVSDDVAHTRDQIQTGPVSGDLSGSITVTGRADVTVATQTGTGSGEFTITATGGTWEGRFEGRFDGGVFFGNLVAHGTGDVAGLILRGTISQTEPNRFYMLTGTILNPGG